MANDITVIWLAAALFCYGGFAVSARQTLFPGSCNCLCLTLVYEMVACDSSRRLANDSWGIAVAIVLVIDMMQPRRLARCTNGMTYIGIGALVGMMVGMTGFSYLWMVAGAAIGVIGGGYVYARTPAGETSRISFGSIFSVSLCQRAAGCSDSVDYRYRGDAMDYRTASGCHHSVHVAGFCILRQHTCIILNYIRL